MVDYVGINDNAHAPPYPEQRLMDMAQRSRGWKNSGIGLWGGATDFYPLGTYNVTWSGTSGNVTMGMGSNGGFFVSGGPNFGIYEVTGHTTAGISASYVGLQPSGISIICEDVDPHFFQLGPIRYTGSFTETYIDDLSRFNIYRTMGLSLTNNSIQSGWDDRPKLDDQVGTWYSGGWPWELHFEACTHANIDLWINIPHLANDDYVKQLSRLANTVFNSGNFLYVEYSNEVWNGNYAQEQYARNVLGDGSTTGRNFAYGKRSAEVWKIFDEHSTGVIPKYVLCGQTTSIPVIDYALSGVTSVEGGTGLLGAISSNAYFNPGKEGLYTGIFQTIGANIESGLEYCRISLANRKSSWESHSKLATQYGVPYIAYEGGQHIVASAGAERMDDDYVDYLHDINRDPGIKDVYNELADQWRDLTGQGIVYLTRIGPADVFGSWGHKEFPDDNSPKNSGLTEHLQDKYESTGIILSLPDGGNPTILNWRNKPATVYDGTNPLKINFPEPINSPFTVQFSFRRTEAGIGELQSVGICEALGFESATEARASCDVGEPDQWAVRSRYGDRGPDGQILFLQNGSSPAFGNGPKWHPKFWHHATMIFDSYHPQRKLSGYLDDNGRTVQGERKRNHVGGDFTGVIIGKSNIENHRLDLSDIIVRSGILSEDEINAHSSGLGLNFNDDTEILRLDNRGPNDRGIFVYQL